MSLIIFFSKTMKRVPNLARRDGFLMIESVLAQCHKRQYITRRVKEGTQLPRHAKQQQPISNSFFFFHNSMIFWRERSSLKNGWKKKYSSSSFSWWHCRRQPVALSSSTAKRRARLPAKKGPDIWMNRRKPRSDSMPIDKISRQQSSKKSFFPIKIIDTVVGWVRREQVSAFVVKLEFL